MPQYQLLKKGVRNLTTGRDILDRTDAEWPEYLAELAAGNVLPIAPELLRPLTERQDAMWAKIKQFRDLKKIGGYNVGGYWFHSDMDSRIQQMELTMMGNNVPGSLMWKTMSGAKVRMTPTLASQIATASTSHNLALFATAEAHQTAMLASPNPEAYDYSTGWPQTYSESLTT